MARFELNLSAPGIRELSLTSTTLYVEVGRCSLFLNLWDMPAGGRWFGVSKFEAGTSREVRIGPVVLMLSESGQPIDYAPHY